MFTRLIYLKHWTFLSLKTIVDTVIVWNETSKLLLKISENKNITLLSDANVAVRFRAQQRAKYSSLQLTANCSAAKRCLRHYFTLIWESSTPEDTLQVDRNRKFFKRSFSTPAIFEATSKLFGSQGCSDDKTWLDLSSIFFKICTFRSSILLSL